MVATLLPTRMTRRLKQITLVSAALAATLAIGAVPAASQNGEQATLEAVTAGPGTLTISTPDGTIGTCSVDGQQDVGECEPQFDPGTVVTLVAAPLGGARFLGWSDFGCVNTSRTCKVTMTGDRYITARFSPVTLTVQRGSFGNITVKANGRTATCTQPTCAYTYAAGTVVTLTRQLATNDLWVGACDGTTGGGLRAKTCRLRLNSNELLGAGLESVTSIPPAKPAALTVVVTLSGKGKGSVAGNLINASGSINCNPRCTVTGDRYDQVRLTARVTRGKWRWSDGWPWASRIVTLSNTTRLGITFR
jgi:Divergent InlB B-repeat domain